MNGELQSRMSRILDISAANYDQKHLKNSKTELENSWIFLPRVGTLQQHAGSSTNTLFLVKMRYECQLTRDKYSLTLIYWFFNANKKYFPPRQHLPNAKLANKSCTHRSIVT